MVVMLIVVSILSTAVIGMLFAVLSILKSNAANFQSIATTTLMAVATSSPSQEAETFLDFFGFTDDVLLLLMSHMFYIL
jgi:hypothetical protein